MAFTAREVIMTFRGQNYLSSAIRRVGRDVGALSRQQQLFQAQRQISINRQRIDQQKQLAAAEMSSLTTGSRSLSLRMRQANLDSSAIRANKQLADTYDQQRRIISQQISNMSRLQEIQAVAAQRGFGMRLRMPANISSEMEADLVAAFNQAQASAIQKANAPPLEELPSKFVKMNQQQLERVYTQEILQQQRLEGSLRSNAAQRELYNREIATQSVASQKVAAVTAEEAARVEYLRERIETLTLADEKQIVAQAQLNMQMRAMPWEHFAQGAQAVEHTGRVLQMFGLIATATFGYLAKSAADFTTQSTLAATQAVSVGNRSVANVQKVGSAISRALTNLLSSGQTTAKPDDLTNAAYRIFSSITLKGPQQQQVREGINLIKQFNEVLTANYGMVDFNQVTQAGIMIINNFDKNLKNVHSDLNTLQAAVRFGNVNMADFIGMLNQAAPAGKAAGYTFSQVASSLAFLTRTLSPRIASAGYARLTELLTKNAQAFHAQGIEVERAGGGLRPLNEIIQEMIRQFPKLATGQMSVISFLQQTTGAQSTVQARRALTQYLHDLSGAQHLTRQIAQDNNELARSAVAAGTSPGVAWAKFTNQLRGLVLLIGQGAIPAFAELGRPIARFLQWFSDLSPHTQRLIGYITALVAVFALLGGTLLSLLGGLATLVIRFRLVIGYANQGQGVFGRLGFAAGDTATQIALLNKQLMTLAETQTAVGESSIAARSGIIIPPGVRSVRETEAASAESAATRAENIGGEAGFARAGAGVGLGAVAAVAGIAMYHKQISQAIRDTGGWRQVLIALAGTMVALYPLVLRLSFSVLGVASSSTLLKRSIIGLGLGALAIVFLQTAAGSEKLRGGLDSLFQGWGSWVAAIAVATLAVTKLKTAFVEMQVATKLSAAWSGITAGAAAAGNAIKGLIARFAALRGAEVATAETGAVASEGGLAAGLGGLSAAIGGFLPALAVGGALVGGLYLWKRHLDDVHDAQVRVQMEQEYIDNYISNGGALNAVRQYTANLTNQKQAQISYNEALRTYKQDIAQGVKGDALQSDIITLQNAQLDLDKATKQAQRSINSFKNELSGRDRSQELVQRFQNDIQRLRQFIRIVPTLSGTAISDLSKGASSGNPLVDRISKLFGVRTIGEAQATLTNYQNFLDRAQKDLGAHTRSFTFAIQNYIQGLAASRQVPQINVGAPLTAISRLIAQMKTPPSIPRIRMMVRAAVALDPSVPRDIPRQYRAALNRVLRLIYTTRTPLTLRQVRFLLRVLLGIDPHSQIGRQMQTIIQHVIRQVQEQMPQALRPPIPGTPIPPGGLFQFPAPTQTLKPPPDPAATHAQRVNQENQVQNTIRRIVALHERAMHTSSLRAWNAYYQTLDAATKKWTGSMGEAFQELLNNAESGVSNKLTPAWQAATQQGIVATATYTRLYNAVNRAQAILQKDPTIANQRQYLAAQKALDNYVQSATQANQQVANSAKTSFQDVLSSAQNMYEQLLQQNQTNFGTLFQGPFINSPAMQNFSQWGGILSGKDLTKDLRSQLSQFRNFNRLLANLQRRGAPQELINQLRALGPQAIQQIRALTQMSGPELKKYFGLFQQGQRAIHQQTMRDLNRQLRDYMKYGRNIALQMIAGIRQEAPGITKAIERAVRRAFGHIGAVQGSTTTTQHNQTRQHHHHHHHHHHHQQGQQHNGEVHHHYEYNVTAPKGSNIDTQVRHAHFHRRNKHRRHRGVTSMRYE